MILLTARARARPGRPAKTCASPAIASQRMIAAPPSMAADRRTSALGGRSEARARGQRTAVLAQLSKALVRSRPAALVRRGRTLAQGRPTAALSPQTAAPA